MYVYILSRPNILSLAWGFSKARSLTLGNAALSLNTSGDMSTHGRETREHSEELKKGPGCARSRRRGTRSDADAAAGRPQFTRAQANTTIC